MSLETLKGGVKMNQDYTKFSENSEEMVNPVIEETNINEEEIIEKAEELAADLTNQTGEDVTVNVTVGNEEEIKANEPEVNFRDMLTGEVVNCNKLNVREEPKKDAKVVGVIEKGAIVNVDPEIGENDFYTVYTPDGLIGYCMKTFIAIK